MVSSLIRPWHLGQARTSSAKVRARSCAQLGRLPQVRALVEERGLHPRTEIRGNEFFDVQPAYLRVWYALAAGPTGRRAQ
jgi:hypothetical protein